ncbi:MAG: succinate dehydrogenase cytochrome b subunit [Bacteroidota bacterium]
MSWFKNFLTSSIGRKLIMSLTGLFLIVFLLVHLVGNFQLLVDDGGQKFNEYALFMTTNPIIKTTSYGLYFFILLHAVQGFILWGKNRSARGNTRYAVTTSTNTTFAGRNMGWLGTIIFIFLILHLWQFWFQMKIGAVPLVSYGDEEMKDLYKIVAEAYSQWWYVAIYVVAMVVIGFHLLHGFQSAFQTLGLNHRKYTPFIKTVGTIYSILIPLGFASIPIFFFIMK